MIPEKVVSNNLSENEVQSRTSDEMSLKDVIINIQKWNKYLLSKWKLIVIFGLLGSILGITYAFFKKPIYSAKSTFVLDEAGSGGSLGQYSGLASVIGLDLGGGSGGGLFQVDNLMKLYKSRLMIQKALLSKVNVNGKDELLIDEYINFNNLRLIWAKDNKTRNVFFLDYNNQKLNRIQDSLLNTIVNDINQTNLLVSKPDENAGIIEVEVKSKDEDFAKNFNDEIVKTVNDFYVQTKTKKSAQNLAILQHQTDSIKQAFNNAILGVASSIDINPNPNPSKQVLKVPSQKRQADVEVNKAILAELVKNLEISKVSLRKETPLIQIIDSPILPLEKNRLGRGKGGIIGGIIGGLLISIIILFRKLLIDILK